MMARSIFTTGERTFTRAIYCILKFNLHVFLCCYTLEFKNGNFVLYLVPNLIESLYFLNKPDINQYRQHLIKINDIFLVRNNTTTKESGPRKQNHTAYTVFENQPSLQCN